MSEETPDSPVIKILDRIEHGSPFEAAAASEELKNQVQPIYRGDLSDVRKQLAEILAKLQTPAGVTPSFSVLEFISLMSTIERIVLDVAWQSVPKNAPTAQLNDWLIRAEVIAKYMRRRLGLLESVVTTPTPPTGG